MQDAFALAVHRRDQFRGEGSLDAWLWRIVVHAARDAGRPLDSSAATFEEELGTTVAVEQAGPRESDEIHALVGALPERQRLALFLRYYADLDYATIAQALEISGGTVAATLNQALENLRRLMTGVKS